MFDIYSLAKPRVFMTEHSDWGGGVMDPSRKRAPDSVEYESAALNEYVDLISGGKADGRVSVNMEPDIPKSVNLINAASDFGGRVKGIINNPISFLNQGEKEFRTEFRPKPGLHNLDFTEKPTLPVVDNGESR